MFDDPKKDLKWLEEQLLAQEQSQEEPEEEKEDWLDPGSIPTFRSQPEDIFRFLEEDMEEVSVPRWSAGKRRKRRKGRRAGRRRFLVFLGIVALLIWWVQWMQ